MVSSAEPNSLSFMTLVAPFIQNWAGLVACWHHCSGLWLVNFFILWFSLVEIFILSIPSKNSQNENLINSTFNRNLSVLILAGKEIGFFIFILILGFGGSIQPMPMLCYFRGKIWQERIYTIFTESCLLPPRLIGNNWYFYLFR